MFNFDPSVIQQRQKGLQDFMQTVLAHADMCEDSKVRHFLLETPRHVRVVLSSLTHKGRGHTRHQSDEAVEIEDSRGPAGKEGENPFDLGESENKKVRLS